MPDYQPLDLSRHCNAGAEVYPAELPPPGGALEYHGLPFQVGPTTAPRGYPGPPTTAGPTGPCLIGFGEGEGLRREALAIPVDATARYLR